MKKWFASLSSAWIGVATHKLRSFLTILGVVIGVSAVIGLMSVGRGAEASIMSSIESLGSDLVFISPGAASQRGAMGAAGSAATLTFEDALAIREQVPYIASVAPSYSTALQVVVGGQNMRARVTGITPEYQQAYNLELADGAFISDYEYQRSTRVAVLGPNVKDTLFEDNDPLGQRIRLGTNIVRVIGVLESKGASMLSTDDVILVPLTALQQMAAQPRTSRGERVVTTITLSVTEQGHASYVVDEITTVLRTRHRLGPGVDDDFRITSMEEIASMVSETMAIFTIVLGAIAGISLLVGGIGVMNIMLVSVIERTREIGIRKALGARERDIWGQFLIEAALLTFTGGIIGVALGWGGSFVVSKFTVLNTVVSPDIIILAVAISVGIGLFFGFYPAWHASRLNPIEALRAE